MSRKQFSRIKPSNSTKCNLTACNHNATAMYLSTRCHERLSSGFNSRQPFGCKWTTSKSRFTTLTKNIIKTLIKSDNTTTWVVWLWCRGAPPSKNPPRLARQPNCLLPLDNYVIQRTRNAPYQTTELIPKTGQWDGFQPVNALLLNDQWQCIIEWPRTCYRLMHCTSSSNAPSSRLAVHDSSWRGMEWL